MTQFVPQLAALHVGLWAVDPWYQRSWLVAPPAIALVLAGWLMSGTTPPGTAPWAKPATPAPANSGTPPTSSKPVPQQQQTCRNNNVDKAQGVAACTEALADASVDAKTRSDLLTRRAYLRNQTPEALADLNEAIRLNPDNYWSLARRGAHRLGERDSAGAAADLNKSIGLNATFDYAWLTRGEMYSQQQQYDQAIKDLTEAIKLSNSNTRAYYLRGLAEFNKGLYAAAARDFSEYHKLNPSDPAGLRLRGNSYVYAKQLNEGIADFGEVLRISPRDQFALALRARAYYWQKKYDQALSDANEALEIDGSMAIASEVRSWINFDRGKYDAAIADQNNAIKGGPSVEKLQLRGRALMGTGQLDASHRDFKQAEQMDPKVGYTQYLLGLVSERRENARVRRCVAGAMAPEDYAKMPIGGDTNCSRNPDYTETAAYFSRSIALAPNFAPSYFDRARILMAQRRLDQAEADVEAGIKLDPNNSEGYLARGNLSLTRERWRDAIDDYTRSIGINSRSAMAFLNRGQAYLKLNERNNAVNDLRASYGLDSNNEYTKSLLKSLGQRI
jgi:tetratricopeptide (TPR) repeat protein